MQTDELLGGLTVVMAVLGGVVSIHAPTKVWHKGVYILLFTALGIASFVFVVRQSKEAAAANATLQSDLVQLGQTTAEVKQLTQRNGVVEKENGELQRRLLDASVAITNLAKRNIATVTGGDSFCYFEFVNLPPHPVQFVAIHHGEYPLYSVEARVFDETRMKKMGKEMGKQPDLGAHWNELNTFVTLGDLKPGMASTINQFFQFSDAEEQKYNVFFSSRNGVWVEVLRIKRVSGNCELAIKVEKGKQVLFRRVTAQYPRNSSGEVDWDN